MPFPQRIGPILLTNSNTTLFTATKTTGIRITYIQFTNILGSQTTVTFNLVPRAGSLIAGNRIINAYPILANDFYSRFVRIPMFAGDTIQGVAAANNAVVFMAEYTDEKKEI